MSDVDVEKGGETVDLIKKRNGEQWLLTVDLLHSKPVLTIFNVKLRRGFYTPPEFILASRAGIEPALVEPESAALSVRPPGHFSNAFQKRTAVSLIFMFLIPYGTNVL